MAAAEAAAVAAAPAASPAAASSCQGITLMTVRITYTIFYLR